MWPFRKQVKELPRIPETSDVQNGPTPGDLKRWMNCGQVNKHKPQLFTGAEYGSIFYASFIFECQMCGFTFSKQAEQLSPTERNALIALGYVSLKEKKNAKSTT